MPPLTIESEEARALADELASRTGESIDRAVTIALRERLERVERQRSVEERLRAINDIVARTAPLFAGTSSKELLHALYDPETGLPA